jgi:hypothetical protein
METQYRSLGIIRNKHKLILLTQPLLTRTKLKIPNFFLICCFLTLYPEDNAFKEFILKRDLSIVLEDEYIINKPKLVNVIKDLQNNKPYPLFAYFLIKPLLRNKNKNKLKLQDDLTFLKHYLKRFKYFYYKYGAHEIGNCSTQHSVKEINFYAVVSLAVILGI